MSRCKGCGILLQFEHPDLPGYTPKKDNQICQRCFKIKHYNKNSQIELSFDNEKICEEINNLKGFAFFLCDILSLSNFTMQLYQKINNPKILIITKVDLLPKNINLVNLQMRIQNVYQIDNLILSSVKNGLGKDKIMEYSNLYERVIFAGPTSSGKSTLINYLFNFDLTVSSYQNTTQKFISLHSNFLTIIDSPGFNYSFVQEIKIDDLVSRTVCLKNGYELIINNYNISFKKDTNLTIYLSKNMNFKTRKVRDAYDNEVSIEDNTDLLIPNIGFIYFKKASEVQINNFYGIELRRSIIGGSNEQNQSNE